MKNITSLAVLAVAFLLAFVGTAFAQASATGGDSSLLEYARPVVDAVLAGRPGVAAALALVFLAAAARRYGGARVAWLNTDAGGVSTVLVGAFGGAIAAALKTGAAFTPGLAWTALGIAAAAAGGWKIVKTLLIDPVLKPFAAKHPWAQPLLAVVLWVFEKPDPIAGAVAAGDAAVKANPAPGADPVVKGFKDVP